MTDRWWEFIQDPSLVKCHFLAAFIDIRKSIKKNQRGEFKPPLFKHQKRITFKSEKRFSSQNLPLAFQPIMFRRSRNRLQLCPNISSSSRHRFRHRLLLCVTCLIFGACSVSISLILSSRRLLSWCGWSPAGWHRAGHGDASVAVFVWSFCRCFGGSIRAVACGFWLLLEERYE